MDGLPAIGVTPNKYIEGAERLEDEVPPLELVTFTDAFSKRFDEDYHFVTYRPFNTGEKPGMDTLFCRMKKPLLARIRMAGASANADILSTMLVLDIDNPGHKPWESQDEVDAFFFKLQQASEKNPFAMHWTVAYTTKSGARLVFCLSSPIPVDEAEAKLIWLINTFRNSGINADMLSDWARLFRLPNVRRDGQNTWDHPFTHVIEQYENRLDAFQLPDGEKPRSSQYAEIKPIYEAKPTPELSRQYRELQDAATGKWKQTQFWKDAKHRLKGRACFACVFDDAPIASEGTRDQTIQNYIGQAVSLLYPLQISPQHVYSLFETSAHQLNHKDEPTDWTDELWEAVCKYYALEEAKYRAVEESKAKEAEKQANIMQRVIEGMKTWCDAPALYSSTEEAMVFASRHALASLDNRYFVLTSDGTYDSIPLMSAQVIARIRMLGMDELMPTQQLGVDGGAIDVPVATLISRHATICTDVSMMPHIKGAYIDNLDTGYAAMRLPSFSRNEKLVPAYDVDVDMWMKLFFGDKHYERAKTWVAYSLAFDEGAICALSIAGDPGAGKKMLVQGLAECLTNPVVATSADLTSDYQYGLLQSPYLNVNEGWDRRQNGKHPADQFRALVSGDPLRAARKFLAPTQIQNPVRVIFTANNLDVVKMLGTGRDLSPEDREALAIRLFHVDIGSAASLWLRSKGGMFFTAREGRRWIRGDGGQRSNYIVAKHFLWLHQNRYNLAKPGSRLLVEGILHDDIMFHMRTQSGVSPLVIECILQMVESHGIREGCAFHEERLYVLAHDILKNFRDNISKSTHEKLTTERINNTLRSLVVDDKGGEFILQANAKTVAMGRKQWHEVDCELLQKVAARDGLKSLRLDAMVSLRQAKKNGMKIVGAA